MRLLHTMLRVNDLDESLKFYCDKLGMKLLRKHDFPGGEFTLAFVGYGDETRRRRDRAYLELGHLKYEPRQRLWACRARRRRHLQNLRRVEAEGRQRRARARSDEARHHGDCVHRGSERLQNRADTTEVRAVPCASRDGEGWFAMKAAVFKKRDEMAVIDVPNPVAGTGEVVLKVHNCGICGSDLHAVQYGIGMAVDTVMGHEFCGEISSMGEGVNGFQLGDRVTALPYIACGVCAWCRRDDAMHCSKLRSLGLGQLPGAYAEYVACGAASLLKLPDNVSSQAGALVEPLSVGLHGVNHSTHRTGNGSSRDGRRSDRPLRINLGQGQRRERGGRIGTRAGPHRACDEARRERGRQPDRERSCRSGQRDHRAPARDCLRMYRRQVDPGRRYRHGGPARPGRRDRRLHGAGQHLPAELRDERSATSISRSPTRAANSRRRSTRCRRARSTRPR